MGRTCKLIYVGRNPNDTLVSFYKFSSRAPTWNFTGSFDDFVKYYQKDGLIFYGRQWDHVLKGLARKEDKNTRFVWFEDMKADPRTVVEELSEFLSRPLKQNQVTQLCDYLQFDNLKNNKMVSPIAGLALDFNFFRKGEVGDWKNYNLAGMEEFNLKWEANRKKNPK